MSAELILQNEGGEPRKIPLPPLFSIGRGAGNDLVLRDTLASRSHAAIRRQGGKHYYVVDLGSSNGTFLNGRRITVPVQLKNGDEIRIGENRMRFALTEEPVTAATDASEGETGTQIRYKSETIAILVVDIRNYTGLSEAIPTEELSRTVGKWFKELQVVIESHGGSVDKFIGDAAMAIWQKGSAPNDTAYVIGPIEAALELVRLSTDYDAQIKSNYPHLRFSIGCGVHIGRAVLGHVGGFTAVGDCVNVAFRIESLCRELQRPIIISEAVKAAAGGAFAYTDLGSHQVKGKSESVHVFGLNVAPS